MNIAQSVKDGIVNAFASDWGNVKRILFPVNYDGTFNHTDEYYDYYIVCDIDDTKKVNSIISSINSQLGIGGNSLDCFITCPLSYGDESYKIPEERDNNCVELVCVYEKGIWLN